MKTALTLIVALLLAATPVARAVRIQDITRLKGDQPNELAGIGLVFGLKNTGDGGKTTYAMRSLQALLTKFGNPVVLTKELENANNVALVQLSVTVPSNGAHIGDRLDVRVSGIACKSLKGGQLFIAPMLGPVSADRTIYALSAGSLEANDENPNVGTVKGGCVMQTDIRMEPVVDGSLTLVLLPASAGYNMATAIADQINEDASPQTEGKPIAVAEDATCIRVAIPKPELARPAAFIARIKALPVPALPGAARVRINARSGTIIFSGDVQMSPAIVSHKGLTINITGANRPGTPGAGVVALDSDKQGGATLKELVEAFNLFKVPPDDRIEIVKQLVDIGALHCELTVE